MGPGYRREFEVKPMPSMPKRKRRVLSLATLAVTTGALIAAPGAQAAVVTIGSPLTASFTANTLCGTLCTIAQADLPGAVVASPSDGTVVRWRVKSSLGPGGFKLRVLHPEGFGAYTGAGTSEVGTPISTGTQVFPTELPIRAGDLIGIDPTDPNATIGLASTASSKVAEWVSPLADGSTRGPDGVFGPEEIALNADVQPLPGITSLKPASGSIKGGTAVTIAGHDFSGTTAVSFGGAPAASFSVDSDTQISAVSPPGSRGAVDVGVKNPGQSPASAADRFTYTACVVPALKGKTLKKAKKALKGAGCALGKVKQPKRRKKHGKARHKPVKVKSQSPKPRKVLPPGAKVSVKLG
jgi:IPT/TIG domain/PASTA domain